MRDLTVSVPNGGLGDFNLTAQHPVLCIDETNLTGLGASDNFFVTNATSDLEGKYPWWELLVKPVSSGNWVRGGWFCSV
jgi:hypothetical protein